MSSTIDYHRITLVTLKHGTQISPNRFTFGKWTVLLRDWGVFVWGRDQSGYYSMHFPFWSQFGGAILYRQPSRKVPGADSREGI